MKICTKCGAKKSLAEFQANRQSNDGKRPECRDCSKLIGAEYRQKNQRKIANRKRNHYNKFKDKIIEQHREYRAANAEQIYDLHKAYRAKNREKIEKWWNSTPRGMLGKSRQMALMRRPTENSVSLDQLMELWVFQKGFCAVTGLTMTWRQGKTQPTSLSIDRLDSNVGYTKDNVRLVCYQVNAFKNRWSDEQMVEMARAIVTKADATSREPTWKPCLVPSEAA